MPPMTPMTPTHARMYKQGLRGTVPNMSLMETVGVMDGMGVT